MTDLILAQVESPGNYIAIWKLILFVIFFIVWAWVGQWMDKDTVLVRTNRLFWNYLYLGTGVAALCLWILLPAPFVVGILLFLVTWLTLSLTYVLHRNARVPAVERILTAEHLRYVFSGKVSEKKVESRLIFYSSHGNELPMPRRDEDEYDGFLIAEELAYDMTFRRASAVNWIIGDQGYAIRYVIDSVAGKADDKPREDMDIAINYLKAVSGLDVKERRKPQTGDFSVALEENKTKWRMKTAGSTRGEQVIFERIEEFETMQVETLGLNPDQLEQVKELTQTPAGVVLVSGPKKSGITSTLYSLIRCHDAFIQNIHALEKSPLCELDNITQNFIEHESEKSTAARRLQSVLLGDPDAVMVGFCDDPEIAVVGMTSAVKDKKKLYFAFEAPSAFHCLQNWIQMVKDNQKAAQALLGITNQRLLRKLCTECRQAYAPNADLLKKLNLPADKIKRFYRPPTEFEYDKQGNPILCDQCQGTGYLGLTAVYELLIVTDAVRQLISENAPFNNIRTQCRKEKMMYLQEQALRKVIDGTTSIQEVMRVTTDASASPKPPKNDKNDNKDKK